MQKKFSDPSCIEKSLGSLEYYLKHIDEYPDTQINLDNIYHHLKKTQEPVLLFGCESVRENVTKVIDKIILASGIRNTMREIMKGLVDMFNFILFSNGNWDKDKPIRSAAKNIVLSPVKLIVIINDILEGMYKWLNVVERFNRREEHINPIQENIGLFINGILSLPLLFYKPIKWLLIVTGNISLKHLRFILKPLKFSSSLSLLEQSKEVHNPVSDTQFHLTETHLLPKPVTSNSFTRRQAPSSPQSPPTSHCNVFFPGTWDKSDEPRSLFSMISSDKDIQATGVGVASRRKGLFGIDVEKIATSTAGEIEKKIDAGKTEFTMFTHSRGYACALETARKNTRNRYQYCYKNLYV